MLRQLDGLTFTRSTIVPTMRTLEQRRLSVGVPPTVRVHGRLNQTHSLVEGTGTIMHSACLARNCSMESHVEMACLGA